MIPKRKTLQIVTKDGVRNILIKSDQPQPKNVIISKSDLQRLTDEAKIHQERSRHDIKLDKDRIKNKSDNLKKQFQWESDDVLESEISVKDTDDGDERKLLLNLAAFQRPEHENESKQLDKLIMNAKCQAIRDQQMKEKQEMKIIEKNNLSKLEEHIEKIFEKKQEEENLKVRETRLNRIRQAQEVSQQIMEKQRNKIIEKEEELMEGERILRDAEEFQKQENERLKRKKAEQKKLLDDLLEEKLKLRQKKKEEREKEQRETLEIAQNIIEKADQRAQQEDNMRKEKQRLRIKYQEMVLNKKPPSTNDKKREDLILRRAYESKEREWRLQELEKVEKKKQIEESLKQSHLEMARIREEEKLKEKQREREDFQKFLILQQEQEKLEQQKAKEKRDANIKYAEEMRKQIDLNKKLKSKTPSQLTEPGVTPPDKSILDKYDHVLRNKIKKLKDENIPEIYLKEVERRYENLKLN